MSKTFVANSRETVGQYWKRFVELVTGWLNRYQFDPFFRTEANVVLLQVAFALIILGLVGTSFSLLYRDISAAIVEGIQQGIETQSIASLGPTIVGRIEEIRSQNLIAITSVIVVTTILFGYLIARVTLLPARNALASQKQFIGNIAHELRTPLSIIKTNTEVILLERTVNADVRGTMLTNIEELDRISDIINNLLSLSTLVRPENMEFIAIDLSELATRVVEKFSHLAKKGNYNITVRKSPNAFVWGNQTALEQVIGNLLKNAIQYTPSGGQVLITVAPAASNHIELIIQDSGIGIARKDLFRIFEPFYRAEQSRNRAAGGSGLGLAIVSELLKLHNGKITIRSAVGRGTSVVIQLPAARGGAKVGGSELHEGLNEISADFSANHP